MQPAMKITRRDARDASKAITVMGMATSRSAVSAHDGAQLVRNAHCKPDASIADLDIGRLLVLATRVYGEHKP